jgi:hypothetical protein
MISRNSENGLAIVEVAAVFLLRLEQPFSHG